jgi:hypothetical protein
MSCDSGIEGPLKEAIGLEEGGILCSAFEVLFGGIGFWYVGVQFLYER